MPDDKRFSTEKLDDAMKELLDICQQYNGKSSRLDQPKANNNEAPVGKIDDKINTGLKRQREFPKLNKLFDDNKANRKHTPFLTKCDSVTSAAETINNKGTTMTEQTHDCDKGMRTAQPVEDGSIDRLQQKQSEVQKQLDDVLQVAKNLDLKLKRKSDSLIDDPKDDGGLGTADCDDEDVELIEFQQIENELRISELNRQLNNIQEQLRLKLYRRLSSRTSSVSPKGNPQTPPNNLNSRESLKRRNSAQTDESTPPSSSCSDDPTASSSMSTSDMTHSSTRNSIDSELTHQLERCHLSKQIEVPDAHRPQTTINKPTNQIENPSMFNSDVHSGSSGTQRKDDLELAFTHANNYEVLMPSQSKPLTSMSNHVYGNIPSNENQLHRMNGPGLDQDRNYHSAFNGFRNCPANNDLERIEEGEEDDDYFCSSDKFRMVYEEKISPIIQAAEMNGLGLYQDQLDAAPQRRPSVFNEPEVQANSTKVDEYSTPPRINDRRFDLNNVNSAKRGNRPLTMYLPKPDEDINLIETVQALGHDLDILSCDLQFTPLTARGYLYKSCSNNSKKWLKRYFYFDRESKVLSYYDNEEQLVKKTDSPKYRIHFDEIVDVYVDHRLNELSEKQKGSKKKSYVFVLATSKRKYLLASTKPETMRAWIDILFTAAKANDYFQQVGDDEQEEDKSLSFHYNSLSGE